MKARRLAIVGAVSCCLLAGCREPTCFRVDRAAAVYAEPHPADYGTPASPNRVITTLPPGRYHARDQKIGKDYLMLEIDTRDHGRGYVELGEGAGWCD